MGIKLDKMEPYGSMGDAFSLFIVDASNVGKCYLCVHYQGESVDKQKHHSLIVDVPGETKFNDNGEIDMIAGLMLHVTAKPATGQTKYRHGRVKIIRNQNLIFTVGQSNNDSHHSPNLWASLFRNMVSAVTFEV